MEVERFADEQARHPLKIRADDQGFTIHDRTHRDQAPVSCRWNEVSEVTIQSSLLFASPLHMIFQRGDLPSITIHQQMGGWPQLVSRLFQALPGCVPKEHWGFELNMDPVTGHPLPLPDVIIFPPERATHNLKCRAISPGSRSDPSL